MFDFNQLNRPSAANRPIDPIELFRSVPALVQTPNDLWQGQSKALEDWHAKRSQRDVLISLHTGAGKSIVGLLVAQSLVNEGIPRVLYLCATNDLVNQTAREIDNKLGFSYCSRTEGSFSNEIYQTGQGLCLTNYNALFNSRTVFIKDLRPGAIIFDDAHVAEKVIRDSYTLVIRRDKHVGVYNKIVALLLPHYATLSRSDYFQNILKGTSTYRISAVPPSATIALSRNAALLDLLKEAERSDRSVGFPLGHLADALDRCTILVSKDAIEICPAFLPTRRLSHLSDPEIRRVYLSATLTSEVDFCRAFGRKPSVRIEPVSDAGVGERLIIMADRKKLSHNGARPVSDEVIASILSKANKLLISTPSYPAASKYKALVAPPAVSEFSQKLDQFRASQTPCVFILVGRVDGIDLPHTTCRLMLADGLPTGFSLLENYLYDSLEMRNSYAAKLANRITQMFGRTNRGRNDYSVIFVSDERFISWLSTPRNTALLPELLRKQLLLGKSLVEQFKINDVNAFPGLASQVVNRDSGWMRYYQDSVSGGDIGVDEKRQAAENDALLTEAALAECEFAGHMWDGNPAMAREALGRVVDKVVVADRRLAGWYNIQLGHAFELEGDAEAAAKQYSQGRSRIATLLALPFPAGSVSASAAVVPKNRLHKKLLEIFANDVRHQNDMINRYERTIMPLFDSSETSSAHEEAMRAFGEALGFEATRPEQEGDSGSTLDVLWESDELKRSILLELKTKKGTNSVINLDDVGQAFNHMEWNRGRSSQAFGIILVGLTGKRSPEAAPSDEMWISTLASFRHLYDDFLQMLLATQRLPPNQRYTEIEAVSGRAEWQPSAIFERLKGLRISELPVG
ncbi:hypothetical protein RPPS3_18810 [Rhodopseudomonas palustris]|uniref:DEAD/DEAH box helicase family protein n=1 Tax=Rhodopseudomonas palustris TaxID=1076 RepID=UPI000D1A62DA|nr:DEAD/DEAH box helicase family protein [Rhodopseudomonas palustris]AVT75944.1 hypothetical protein RPPS3_18810 [Rhodopseudomonas palustris]